MNYNKIYKVMIARHQRRLNKLESIIDLNLKKVLKDLLGDKEEYATIKLNINVIENYYHESEKIFITKIYSDGSMECKPDVAADVIYYRPLSTKVAVLTKLKELEKRLKDLIKDESEKSKSS